MKRVGFIVDSQVPSIACWRQGSCRLRHLAMGWASTSPVGVMRYGWIADCISRSDLGAEYVYELYRPWRRYDVVVFLKSMGAQASLLEKELASIGVRTIFDCNVDYVTPSEGTFYYEGMAPTEAQRQDALDMVTGVRGVIGDSEQITEVCAKNRC